MTAQRILFCIPEFHGFDGATTLARDALRHLEARGHRVDCAVLRYAGGEFDPRHYLRSGQVRDYVHPIGRSLLARQSFRIGLKLLPRRVDGGHFCPPGYLRFLRRNFDLDGYDLVVGGGALFAAIAPLFRCPTVCEMHELFTHKRELLSAHGIELMCPFDSLEEELAALSYFDVIWCPSAFIRETLAARLPGVRLLDRHLSWEGVVSTDHVPRSPGPDALPRLLFVGSTAPENRPGIRVFLERILPRIREQVPAVEFHVVGWQDHDFPAGVSLAGVVGHGRLPTRDDVRAMYEQAQVVVIPRFLGGLTIKGVETLALGKATVGHPMAFSGCYEVENGRHAFVVENDADFVGAATRLLTDVELRQTMEREARAFAVETFDADRIYAPLLELAQGQVYSTTVKP